MSKRERFLAAGLSLLLIAVRAAAFFRYRFDSDEPQHLHVAWGWTAGLVQYRDLFDNHAPLFHLATAPFLALFGERADILLYMRALMIPIWVFVCVATFVIARRFHSTRVAVWSVLILNLVPTFFLKSIEFRTDNLWTGVWMAAFLALMHRRMFATGFLLGLAACVSLKTPLLVITLLLTGIAMRKWRDSARLVPAVIGFVIAPAIIAFTFVKLGAWHDLVYCNFTFNELVSQTRRTLPLYALYPVAVAAIIYFGRRLGFLAIVTLAYTSTLICWWILISPRDFLAILPIAAIVVAAWLDQHRLRVPALAALIVVCAIRIGYDSKWLKNDTPEFITMMNQVLGLTRPGEPLIDYKGETIYRRRPYYFIFEAIGRAELARGFIPDTIEHDVIAARCHVAQADGDFWPRAAKTFLVKHYIDLGRLRASGNWVPHDGAFHVAIPGTYVILDKHGIAPGTLDGVPYRGAVQLAPGVHRFERAHDEAIAWLWAPAFERGYSPFHLRDREF